MLQISCIEGLETLTALEVLDLSDNKISRIRNLKTLTRLKKVNLSANYIGSIECLTELTDVSDIEYNFFEAILIQSLRIFCST